ncbi:MAG: 3-dehydroquinate synthase family protein [Chitinophagales bacterium]|nr:3-dehydroquinate synthase [Chitinophagales bacterium]MDW8394015.1 3-dehydroquinate synthase family protein [Chitinophagales bacterium]
MIPASKTRYWFGPAPELLLQWLSRQAYSKCFILTDDNTSQHCLPVLLQGWPADRPLHEIKVYAGEQNKTLQAAEYIWQQLTLKGADRHALLINLGGGMICDLGGFAAATYKRGIAFLHLPTTLLAQADAAYGGKLAIDFMNYKNHIGVFGFPVAVISDRQFLKTLPADQVRSGFAEIIKHALLDGKKALLHLSEIQHLQEVDWSPFIARSVKAKLKVTEADPFERHDRKVLNFGHTIGHAIEGLLLHRKANPLHGLCVAAGMIAELYLSHHCCGLKEKTFIQAVSLLRRHFPDPLISEADFAEVLGFLRQDKKNREGEVRFVLLRKAGKAVLDVTVTEEQILEALDFLVSPPDPQPKPVT